MKISEVAKKTGLTSSAIRFYERNGVLAAPKRGANGYRSYTSSDEQRLHLICIAQNLGFSLAGIKSVLKSAPGVADTGVLTLIDDRLLELDRMMAVVQAQRQDIVKIKQILIASWQAGTCISAESLSVDMATPARSSPATKS